MDADFVKTVVDHMQMLEAPDIHVLSKHEVQGIPMHKCSKDAKIKRLEKLAAQKHKAFELLKADRDKLYTEYSDFRMAIATALSPGDSEEAFNKRMDLGWIKSKAEVDSL